MILVGLNLDFFGEGGTVGEPEFRFELSNESPEYKIRGYIDKTITYPDGHVKIVDYKSSKAKFSGDDLEANVQAMVYSLVGYKILKAKKASAEFIFLRFPKQPLQQLVFTESQLKGLEHYLSYMYELTNSLTAETAKNNLAINCEKKKWLCKAGKWECPYLRPFKYHALLDAEGNVARTALKKEDLKPEPGQTFTILEAAGCPGHPNISSPTKKIINNDFD